MRSTTNVVGFFLLVIGMILLVLGIICLCTLPFGTRVVPILLLVSIVVNSAGVVLYRYGK